MPEDVQKVKETVVRSGNTLQKTTEVHDTRAASERQQTVAENVVWFVVGIISVLLAFRFLLSLLGANTSNTFANFIYNVSHPFVEPFFSLFKYNNYTLGSSHFEAYTLVAILFYLVVGWGIARLVTIDKPS